MSVDIMKASFEDIDKLIEVQNESFYDDFIMYGECPAYNESKQAMEEYIKNAIVYKILWDNEIIGDVIVRKKENGLYYLRVICVIPKYQNFGVGKKAIQFIENDISDAAEWELITPAKSYRNHHFYEKLGYVKVNEYVHSDVLSMFVYKKKIKSFDSHVFETEI